MALNTRRTIGRPPPPRRLRRRRPGGDGCARAVGASAGFTLIDLLIAVCIAALVLTLALPGYRDQIARARRSAGRAALVQAALWIERAAASTGILPDETLLPTALRTVEGDHYRIEMQPVPVAAHGGPGFLLLAVPVGAQARDRCGTLVLSDTGERSIARNLPDATPDACWNR